MGFPNLEYIGMFSLGAFVGGIINYGLNSIESTKSYAKVVTTSFGAAFGGSLILFLEKFDRSDDDSIYMYPIGLILSLLWGQIVETINTRIGADEKGKQIIGWIHLTAVSGLTIYLTVKLLFPL